MNFRHLLIEKKRVVPFLKYFDFADPKLVSTQFISSTIIPTGIFDDKTICKIYQQRCFRLEKNFKVNFSLFDKNNVTITNMGKTIKSIGDSCPWVVSYCSNIITTGIHTWRIKLVSSTCEYYGHIGIVDNITNVISNEATKEIDVFEWKNFCLYKETGQIISKMESNNTTTINVKEWELGEVVTVSINCHMWQVSFYKDGKVLGAPVKILPNTKYYPVIAHCGHKGYHFECIQ